jgi:hypothetical protein
MIPHKIFGRMIDLVIADHRDRSDRTAERELDSLQELYEWPWRASESQSQEWNELHLRLDPNPSMESNQ